MFIREAMQVLGVSYNTVRNWGYKGRLRRTVLPNGRINYWDDDVYAQINKKITRQNWNVIYTRVSKTTELKRKEMYEQKQRTMDWCAARGYIVDKMYEDWSLSTEFSVAARPGFHQLLQDIILRRVSVVIIETSCRITKVGWEIWPLLFGYYGVTLHYISNVERPEYIHEQQDELTNILAHAIKDRTVDINEAMKELKLDEVKDLFAPVKKLPGPKKTRVERGGGCKTKREMHPRKIAQDWNDDTTDLSDML